MGEDISSGGGGGHAVDADAVPASPVEIDPVHRFFAF
jgi:hypothetical protein